jgi:hypothetical protein
MPGQGQMKVPVAVRGKHRAWAVSQGLLRSAGVAEIHPPIARDAVFALYDDRPFDTPPEFVVYGLVCAGRLIYVGKSGDFANRTWHRSGAARAYDSVFWLRVDSHASAAWWESVLIDILRPECNAHWGDVLMARHVTESALLLLRTEAGPEICKIMRRAMDYQSGISALP